MQLHPRSPQLLAALLPALALAACSSGGGAAPIACAERADCPGDAFCRSGACVQGAAPIARIAALDAIAPRANRVLTFDASGSLDPDSEDQLVAFAWRTAAASAGCEAQPYETAGTRYSVIIPCPGSFRVELTVTDSTGMTSTPASVDLRVLADEVPPPSIVVGADLELEHQCSGEPLSCTPVGAAAEQTFALSAQASGGKGPLRLSWTVASPAGLQLEPGAVTWSDQHSGDSIVAIRTAGAISGLWQFTVLAQDADGRAATSVQRVTVLNRAPVAAAPLESMAVHHRYDAADGVFAADVPVQVPEFVDPDGDPLRVSLHAETAGDGGRGAQADGATLRIRIPAAEPQHLIGADVQRSAVVLADDGNGAVTRLEAPITVLNRAPRVVVARTGATVPHRYDVVRGLYVATAMLSDYVDDDGDPLAAGELADAGTRGCMNPVMSGATLNVVCEVPYTTVSSLSNLVGAHVVGVTARDPWERSPQTTARIQVTNNAPRVTLTAATLKGLYTEDFERCCVKVFGDVCTRTPAHWSAVSSTYLPVEDADGDPLAVAYEKTSPHLQLSLASSGACVGIDCLVRMTAPATAPAPVCESYPELGSLTIGVSDGVAGATSTLTVTRGM